MSVICGKDLACIKRDRVLFENLTFQINAHEVVHLKGSNGAGKTSLMRIMAGLSEPTEGNVFFNHENIANNWDNYTSNILYIGHKSGCNAMLNGIENTKFWMTQQGLSVTNERIEEVLLTLGLAGLEDLPVCQLSAGQQRRVALARLWLKPTATLWLLDEPFTALDADGILLIENQLKQHVENGGCALVTSHQPLQKHQHLREWVLEYRF